MRETRQNIGSSLTAIPDIKAQINVPVILPSVELIGDEVAV